MMVMDLIALLNHLPMNAEIRIGDQIEAGPYLHQAPGGVWVKKDPNGAVVKSVILCAGDDDLWTDETINTAGTRAAKLPIIWLPDNASDEARKEAGL